MIAKMMVAMTDLMSKTNYWKCSSTDRRSRWTWTI